MQKFVDFMKLVAIFIGPRLALKNLTFATISLYVLSVLVLLAAGYVINKEYLVSFLICFVRVASLCLIALGMALYAVGLNDKDTHWTGWGLWCLNGLLGLSVASGGLIIIGHNTSELSPNVVNGLYVNELWLVGIYTVLVVIHLFIHPQPLKPSDSLDAPAESDETTA